MPRKGAYGDARRALVAGAPDGLGAFVVRYVEAQALRGIHALTIASYRRDLIAFHAWCSERDVAKPTEITKPVLERYQRHLFYYRQKNGQPLSLRRQVLMLTRVRSFFRWLARHNFVLSNPASDLDVPRVPRRSLPDALTAAEAEAILAAFDLDDPAGVLGRAMAEVLYSTGLRRAELCDLTVFDLDPARGVVHVRKGKGGKGRMVPIGERALAWIRKYVDDVRPQFVTDPAERALFVNERGAPVNAPGLGDRIDQAKRRAGITKRGACHLFRHTAATLMLENGADVRYIQEMLGHARLDTTEIYTHVSIGKLKAIHAATHPAAKLERQVKDDSAEEA
jgi:integrase/recombinase XerD